jgi:penicillin-insensitive murein DD-endopeptidase
MRLAGLFSHLVLAFVCASMTFVAFESAPFQSESSAPQATPEPPSVAGSPSSADPAPFRVATAPAATQSIVNEPATPSVVTQPVASQLDHWSSTARPLDPEKAPTPATVLATVAPAPEPVARVEPAPVVHVSAPPIIAATPPPVPAPSRAVINQPAPLLAPPQPAPIVVAALPSVPPTPAPATADVSAVSPDPPADTGGTPGLKPAKALFGAIATPAPLAARAIGSYAKGCLSGGQALPVDGPAWQAMRLSRNRNWGHPKLIKLIEKLAADGKEKDGWPGLLVGDIAQPRGGPMITGHASHQIGLDADLWLTPMPDRRLTSKERETIEATSMLSEDPTTVNRDVWTEQHLAILKRAASYPEVERIFIHPAIKQVLCYAAKDDRSWLSKVRAYWGHHYHFHVRMHCPAGSPGCEPQKSVPGDDGCGKELDDWLKLIANVKPDPAPLPIPAPPVVAAKPSKEKPPMTLDQLPQECSVVLETGNPQLARDIAAAAKAAEIAKAVKILKANEKPDPAKPALSAQSKPQTSSPPAPKPHASQKKTATQ